MKGALNIFEERNITRREAKIAGVPRSTQLVRGDSTLVHLRRITKGERLEVDINSDHPLACWWRTAGAGSGANTSIRLTDAQRKKALQLGDGRINKGIKRALDNA
jgi:hypothetical protein